MNREIAILSLTAVTLGFLHTLLGPDHYLPFIMMSRARRWTLAKTAWITFFCGLGHVGSSIVVGLIGVALGLYICAHPAANAINMLFFERDALRTVRSDWPLIRWLALNMFALLVGWMVVFAGIRRLVDRTT